MTDWGPARDARTLESADFEVEGVVFRADDGHLYRTTGERIGQGGMGSAYHLLRRAPGEHLVERAVGKLFRDEFLSQVMEDEAALRHFEHNLLVLERLRQVRDLHVLPVLASQRLRDNHLVLTPFAGEPFVRLVVEDRLSVRDRVGLLLQAVRGLRTLHDAGIVHGDFTLRNVLVATQDERTNAMLFDFDLSIALDVIGPATYASHYDGRVVGSPEYSVVPEQLDPVLVGSPLSPRRDLYAVGTALFGLFTDVSVYGEIADLPTLLQRIADGMVRRGVSRIAFPDEVPGPVRDVIVRCLERDPELRHEDSSALVRALELVHRKLSRREVSRFHGTFDYLQAQRTVPLADILARRPDTSVSADEVREMQTVLARQGYLIERSLGRVKGHPIYLAAPDPALVATGRFLEPNALRKIVTAIDLRGRRDAEAYVGTWLGRIRPILEKVRQAFLTSLHKVIADRPSGRLLIFSEYIEDPRFGADLADQELTLEEALGLSLIVADQLAHLHQHGLAHGNVSLSSILFKGLGDPGEARPFLVGLVEPSFEPSALAEDVRRLALIAAGLLAPGRIEEQPPERRPVLNALRANLEAVAAGEAGDLPIGGLVATFEDGLALIDRNFDVIRRHGGDPVAFARTMTRHSLFRRLWG